MSVRSIATITGNSDGATKRSATAKCVSAGILATGSSDVCSIQTAAYVPWHFGPALGYRTAGLLKIAEIELRARKPKRRNAKNRASEEEEEAMAIL